MRGIEPRFSDRQSDVIAIIPHNHISDLFIGHRSRQPISSFYFRFYLVYSLQMTSHILFAVFTKATWCNISGSLNEQNPSSTRVSTSRVAENQWSDITDSNCHQQLGRLVCYHYTNIAYLMWWFIFTRNPPLKPRVLIQFFLTVVQVTGVEPAKFRS